MVQRKKVDDKLIKLFRDYNQSASDNTIKTYASNIQIIFDDLGEEAGNYDTDVLKDADEVMEALEAGDYSLNTLKNKLAAIVIFLLAHGVDKKIVNKYSEKIDSLTAKIDREKAKMHWTGKEKNNMLTYEEMEEHLNKLKVNIPKVIHTYKDAFKYQSYLIGKFHLEAPLRNDLADCKIFLNAEYEKVRKEDDVNYLILNVKTKSIKIILNKFKTKKTYKQIDFDIDDKDLFNFFLKYYRGIKELYESKGVEFEHWLLFKGDLKRFTRNDFTYFFNKIYEDTGKKISTSLIRKVVLSEKVYNVDKIKKYSKIMGHSISEAIHSYVKN
jgi:hypothetical protein